MLLNREFERIVDRVLGSRSLVASGTYADAPGGFLVIEADSSENLSSLLVLDGADNFYITVDNLLPFERLVEHLGLWKDAEESFGVYDDGIW